MVKKSILLIIIFSIFLFIQCGSVLKWDNLLENKWKDIVVEVLYIEPNENPGVINVSDNGRIFVFYKTQELAIYNYYLASTGENS